MTAKLIKRGQVSQTESKPAVQAVSKTPEQIRREWQAERAIVQSQDAAMLARLRAERRQGR